MFSIDYTRRVPLRLSKRISLWYRRPMTAATYNESPWVTGVSIEDDYGNIHEFSLPEGVCTHEQFLGRIYAAWLQQPVRPSEIKADSLSDLIVMAVLGFWTFLVGNLLFNLIWGVSNPPEPPWQWCIYSMSRGRCVADLC